MIFENENELKDRIEEFAGWKIREPVKILRDTTDFMDIQAGMLLRLDGCDFFIRGDATEGRFGVDENPKYWVKYAIDLETGKKNVLKLVFYEDFTTRIGPFLIRAHRNPQKESHVLDVVRNHPHFMQGRTALDRTGNLVRIIDFVEGENLYRHVQKIKTDHETYFHEKFPAILRKLMEAFEAVAFLMNQGEQHGDIRSDHIIMAADSGRFVWIDFDFDVSHSDYDLWCLGNVFNFVVGMGNHMFQDVKNNPAAYPGAYNGITLGPEDSLMCSKGRIASLGQLFPYIPEKFNRILDNFAAGTSFLYEDIQLFLEHVQEALDCLND